MWTAANCVQLLPHRGVLSDTIFLLHAIIAFKDRMKFFFKHIFRKMESHEALLRWQYRFFSLFKLEISGESLYLYILFILDKSINKKEMR